jgi:hypothetical protein
MRQVDELRHLLTEPNLDEQPEKLGIVRFDIWCPGNSETVLQKSKEVLEMILRSSTQCWLSNSEWQTVLPDWFVAGCAPEKTIEEVEQWLKWWRSLSPQEKSLVDEEQSWSLEDWLYWLHPDQRQWFWWDAICVNTNLLKVAVEVAEYPFSWKSLAWLFKVAGAIRVQPED